MTISWWGCVTYCFCSYFKILLCYLSVNWPIGENPCVIPCYVYVLLLLFLVSWRQLAFVDWDFLFAKWTRVLPRYPCLNTCCVEDVLNMARQLADKGRLLENLLADGALQVVRSIFCSQFIVIQAVIFRLIVTRASTQKSIEREPRLLFLCLSCFLVKSCTWLSIEAIIIDLLTTD